MDQAALIAVPYFGGTKYRGMLDAWVAQYEKVKPRWPYVVFTDGKEALPYPHVRYNIDGYRDVLREAQPFDVKGALMCEAALDLGPFLMVDADAFLAQDPAPILQSFWNFACAMPQDHGAIIHWRTFHLSHPYSHVEKKCAGVMWFGQTTKGHRTQLVREYKKAWQAMADTIPWTPRLPHLLEQYSWSVVCYEMCGGTLPISMNWAPGYLGVNNNAVINHLFGLQKRQA